jgi:hypothetical protein
MAAQRELVSIFVCRAPSFGLVTNYGLLRRQYVALAWRSQVEAGAGPYFPTSGWSSEVTSAQRVRLEHKASVRVVAGGRIGASSVREG